MHRTERRTAIIEELRRAGPAGRTAASLAARLGASVRTIRRDLLALQLDGIPVAATVGPGGGYVLDQPCPLPAIRLTPGQVTASAVALATAGNGPLTPDAAGALEKLLDVLSPREQEQVAELAVRGPHAPGGVVRTPVTATLEQALRERRVLAIDYEDALGRRTIGRRVEPHLFAFTGGHWYLLAWCLRRLGPRWFRWDRISRAVLTDDPVGERDPIMIFGTPPPGVHAPRRR